MAFDPEIALGYARTLARPRRVGSGEDEKVASEIAAHLEQLGYQVEREPFIFTRAFDIALAAEIALALALVLLALLVPARAFVFGISILGLLAIARPLNRAIQYRAVAPDRDSGRAASTLAAVCLRLGRLYRAANVVATPTPFPSPVGERSACDGGGVRGGGGRPHLYLVSHFDSKSQLLPIPVRIFLFAIFLPGAALVALSTLAQSLVSNLHSLTLLLGLVCLLCGLPLLLLDVRNESPGAIDNASGTGLLLHLAGVLSARPDLLSRIRLTLLITSAEEMATLGALYHVKRRAGALRGQELYVLNLDGIGVDGKLFVAGRDAGTSPTAQVQRRRLHARLRRAAAALQIPLALFSFTGVLFDHVPFAEHGLDAATLLVIGGASRYVHTRGDSADKLHPHGFEMAGKVALRVIEELAALPPPYPPPSRI